ncbi:MAG: hypothetical protein ACC635_06850 [Acidiferrobacterales bacterium]
MFKTPNLLSGHGLKKLNIAFLVAIIFTVTACDVIDNSEGDQATLCYDYYQACVSPLLNTPVGAPTCANGGCHLIGSGSGGRLAVEPTGSIDSFNSAFGMVDLFNKDNSLLLRRPNDPTHTGGVFPALAPGTVCYNQIRTWMDTVVTEQPADQTDPPCASLPACTVPDATTC